MALTDKQQAFINAYIQSWNATKAALDAGYSEDSAHSIGWENLRKPAIADEIRKRIENQAMTGDEVLARLAKQARGSMAQFIQVPDGANVPLVDWERARDNGDLDLIKEIKIESGVISFKLYDAQAALIQLGKALNVLTERQDITSGGEKLTGLIINLDDHDAPGN